jgi:FixJ family two-component response regulator
LFSEAAPLGDTLSSEELQVVELICVGKTSGRIAKDLGISFQSTVGHRMRILQKMDTVKLAMAGNASSRIGPHASVVLREQNPYAGFS